MARNILIMIMDLKHEGLNLGDEAETVYSLGRLAPVLKTIFHQYTYSQFNSDGSVLGRAIRVRLATSILYDTLVKNVLRTGTSL